MTTSCRARIALLLLAALAPATSSWAGRPVSGEDVLRWVGEGELDRAERFLRESLARKPEPEVRYLLGYVLLQQYRAEEAERLLAEAVAQRPDRHAWIATHASALRELRRCSAAMELLAKAIALAPRPEYRYERAMCAQSSGRTDIAEEELRALLAAVPGDSQGALELGRLLARRGQRDEARSILRAAVVGGLDDAEGFFELGLLEDDGTEALRCFDRALALVPGHVGALYQRGRALARLGRREESKVSLDRFREESGREERIQNLAQYVQNAPDGVEQRLELAALLEGQGRIDEAIEHLEAVRARRPDLAPVYPRLARLYQRAGRPAEAARAAAHGKRLGK